jgi:hypothetical protein
LPKQKQPAVEMLVKSYHVASNYHHHMKTLECSSLREEIEFYRSFYSLQKNYVESIIGLFKIKYQQFLDELKENFYAPLSLLVEKFWLMKGSDDGGGQHDGGGCTEESLRDFLNLFKVNSKRFQRILHSTLTQTPTSDQVSSTFEQLIAKLDDEIEKLNKHFVANMANLSFQLEDVSSLSLESDKLLAEIIAPATSQASEMPLNL